MTNCSHVGQGHDPGVIFFKCVFYNVFDTSCLSAISKLLHFFLSTAGVLQQLVNQFKAACPPPPPPQQAYSTECLLYLLHDNDNLDAYKEE